MHKVYKYRLEVTDSQTMYLPRGARILTVQLQGADLMLWAVVDTEADWESWHFRVYGTGQPMDEIGLPYVGTVQMASGALVFHVFATPEGPRHD